MVKAVSSPPRGLASLERRAVRAVKGCGAPGGAAWRLASGLTKFSSKQLRLLDVMDLEQTVVKIKEEADKEMEQQVINLLTRVESRYSFQVQRERELEQLKIKEGQEARMLEARKLAKMQALARPPGAFDRC